MFIDYDQISCNDYENLYIMMFCGILILIFTSLLYKYLLYKYNIKSSSLNKTCVILNNMYPEINDIIIKKSIILDELTELIKSGIWSEWNKKYKDNKWKKYNLILEHQIINNNISICPDTYNIIKDIPGLINASFSCLEPHSIIPYHNNNDTRFYRIHIPLITPSLSTSDDLGINIKNQFNNINHLSWSSDYFVFNNTCEHQAFNNTDYYQIVLVLDIERR